MLTSDTSCFFRLVVQVKSSAFLGACDGRDGGVGERSQEAGVAGGLDWSESTRMILTVGSESVGDKQTAEKGLEGWEDEVVATSDLWAVKGQDGGEESA